MMTKLLKSFLADAKGATAVEYGLLASLIAVGMLVGLTAFGDNLNNTFMMLSNKIEPKD